MIQLSTKFFGVKEISEEELLHFPEGIYGFTEEKLFIIFKEKEDSPFLWFQSLYNKDLAFVIIDPNQIIKNYKPKILHTDLQTLEVNYIEECKIYAILTIPENKPEEMTINLQGPILINMNKKIGKQVISLDETHGVRMNLLQLLKNQSI